MLAGSTRAAPPAFSLALTLVLATASSAGAAGELRGWDDDLADGLFDVIADIDPASGSASVPAEFAACPNGPPIEANTLLDSDAGNPIGFVTGLTFIGSQLYALDWDSGSVEPPIRLATIAADPLQGGCAYGEDVDAQQAIGFVNLESLAWCDDDSTLYSVDWDPNGSEGQLISIDEATGIGSEIVQGQHLANDLRVVGLACASGTLWGVTSGFGTRQPELITIDRATATATVIGPTGTTVSTEPSPVIESLAVDPDSASLRLVAAGPDFWEIDASTGVATQIVGDDLRSVWGLATQVPEPATPALALAALAALAISRGRRAAAERQLP